MPALAQLTLLPLPESSSGLLPHHFFHCGALSHSSQNGLTDGVVFSHVPVM